MGTVRICLCTRKQQKSLTMRVLVAITLALAISYVKADHHEGAHHDHAAHDVYEARDDGYGPPEPAYGAPEPSYEPAATYESAPSYEPEPPLDLTPFIVAILVIVGLSLLFPLNVRINDVTGRKKREAEEISRSDFVGRTAEIYDHLNEILEPVDRNCMEKITCEVGGLAYDAGITSHPFLQLVVPFVPGKYGKYMKHFIYADNCHKIKCSAYP